MYVKPYKNGCRCPKCNRRGEIITHTKVLRKWQDIPIHGIGVFLVYQPKEIYCPTHGRVQEDIPWAEEYSRITYRFEYATLKFCRDMTQKAAADLLKIPKSTLSDNLHRIISRIREGHRIRDLNVLGVDEISYAKGHKYATIVYSRVI